MEPLKVWMRLRPGLKWAWRGLLGAIAALAVLWIGALVIGSCRLNSEIDKIRNEPGYPKERPSDWPQVASGEGAAPYFSAAALMVEFPKEWGDIDVNSILEGKWSELSELKRKAVRGWVDRNERAFDLARTGADQPTCRFFRSWPLNQDYKFLPEQGWLYWLMWLTECRAWVNSGEGRSGESMEAIRVTFALADAYRNETSLKGQEDRLTRTWTALLGFSTLVPDTATEAELEELQKMVPSPDHFSAGLDRALEWERYELAELLADPVAHFWAAWGEYVPSHRKYEKSLQRRLADPLVKLDGVRALEDLRRIRDVLRRPYSEARATAEQLDAEQRSRSDAWNPVRTYFQPWTLYLLELLHVTRSSCVLARTGLEWEKIKLRTGTYPSTCEVVDPLTGRPFILEQNPPRLISKGGTGLKFPQFREERSWFLRP